MTFQSDQTVFGKKSKNWDGIFEGFFLTVAVNIINRKAVLLISNPQLVLHLKVDPVSICLYRRTCFRFRCLCVWE